MEPVRFGVIGAAGIIGGLHLKAIQQSPHAKLVGLTDVNRDRAGSLADETGARFYADVQAMLDDPEIEAVTLCVPHPLHAPLAVEAFQAGKHVLCEKPLAVSVSEADRMISAARRAGKKLGVVFQHRLRGDIRRMKSLVDEGMLGPLYRTALADAFLRIQGYYNMAPWRGTWAGEAGGVLMNQAPHSLDLFQWLGGRPRRVLGLAGTVKHRIEVEDMASAVVEYSDGGHGSIHCNTVQAPGHLRIELWGDRGALQLENGRLQWNRLGDSIQHFSDTETQNPFGQPKVEIEALPETAEGPGHMGVIDDFALAVRLDREPLASGEEAIWSLELANAIILSSYTRDWVELPVDRNAYDSLLQEFLTGKRLHPPKVG